MAKGIPVKANGIEFSKGNHKIGKDTAILNITSATDCPSKKKGLCPIPPGKCYALKAERACRPEVLPYRRRQTKIWDSHTALQIATAIIEHSARAKYKIKYLRYSEAGDFRRQGDIYKMSLIAHFLGSVGIKVYGYTSRKDLSFNLINDNMVVNGTGFRVHNIIRIVPKKLTKHLNPKTSCKMNCRVCNLCKERRNTTIFLPLH